MTTPSKDKDRDKDHPQTDHDQAAEPVTPAEPEDGESGQLPRQTVLGLLNSLAAIDANIRKTSGDENPGAGLHMLLDQMSVALLGNPRTAFPLTSQAAGFRGQNFAPGIAGDSPPGPLPGAGRGQAKTARSSAPNTPGP